MVLASFVKAISKSYTFINTTQIRNLYQSSKIRERQYRLQRRTRRDVKSQLKPIIILERDEVNMRGKLYGGGTCELILTGEEITQRLKIPTSTLPDTGVVKIAVLEPTTSSWTPPNLPISTISNHPLEVLLSYEGLQRIKDYCRQPSDSIIALSAVASDVYIQPLQLQNLISHGKQINDEVVALFLEIVCSHNNHAFLCPQILPLLKLNGWSAITKYFANPLRRKYRTIFKPNMAGEDAIAIPCYVNNCHWVSVVRREIGRQVIFCYSDDLNCPETEQSIRKTLSQETCPRFYPSYATWINCKTYTYRPHSNECGPRMLFATLIMLNHPNPHENILLPYMHPNLAQLSRVWVAQTILTGEPSFPCEPQSTPSYHMFSQLEARSEASSVISWDPQSNFSASLYNKLTDENITSNKDTVNHHDSSSTQEKEHFKQPMVTTNGNLRSQQETISNLGLSTELLSSETVPRESKSHIGEDSNRKNKIKQQSRLKTKQKVQQPFRQQKPKKTTLFDHIQPKITDYFQTKNENQSSRVHKNVHKKMATETKKDNSNLSGISTIEEMKIPEVESHLYRFTPAQDQTQSRFSGSRNINHAFDSQIFSGSYGHALEEIDSQSALRIVLQNPNGLNLKRDSDFETCTRTCEAIGAGLICFSETNFNWKVKHLASMMVNIIRKTWRTTAVQMSHHSETFKSSYQPGGTLTIVTDRWVSRITSRGTDPFGMGRWSYILLRGNKGEKIMIVTAYRVCKAPASSLGEKTASIQQFRTILAKFNEEKRDEIPNPHRQFILDLQSWLEEMKRDGTSIILCLDNNEDLLAHQGSFHQLEYKEDTFIKDSQHNGTLATLAKTCNLIDALGTQHPGNIPATYSRGSTRLDYILISEDLFPAVQRTGILPYYSLCLGHHRPCYIDLDAVMAFGDTCEIAPPQTRGLQLQDPKKREQYKVILNDQLEYHKVHQAKMDLVNLEAAGQWTEDTIQRYQKLDKIISESMRGADKMLLSRKSGKYMYSPKLASAVQAVRNWRLRLKRLNGIYTTDHQLQVTADLAGLPENVHQTIPRLEVVKQLRESREVVKSLQLKHYELRQSHLEERAEAILLKRHEHLADPENEEKMAKEMARQIRLLARREQRQRMFKKITATLNPNSSEQGALSTVWIPYGHSDPYPSGPDPKTWTGEWSPVFQPEMIAAHVCAANKRQYNQAMPTPFGSGSLAEYVGLKADTEGAQLILEGILPPASIMDTLLPETTKTIKCLATPLILPHQDLRVQITPEEFISTYKVVQEKTSSSPSGRHVGHYKAILDDPQLVSLHATMMSLPFQVGFSPERWQQIVDVMLEKQPGNASIHRLQIVALLESDFN